MSEAGASETVHASCIVVGEIGILIEGPSGSGKSTLAREAIALAHAEGRFARLVGDDRILLRRRHGRLLASGHPVLQGLIEVRGQGILPIPWEQAATLHLAVLCDVAPGPRMPEAVASVQLGVRLPVLRVHGPGAAGQLLARLRGVDDTASKVP